MIKSNSDEYYEKFNRIMSIMNKEDFVKYSVINVLRNSSTDPNIVREELGNIYYTIDVDLYKKENPIKTHYKNTKIYKIIIETIDRILYMR